jgi:hypothetical protein
MTRIVEITENARAVTIDDFGGPVPDTEPKRKATKQRATRNKTNGAAKPEAIPDELAETLEAAEGRGVCEPEPFEQTPWSILNAQALASLDEWVPELLGGIAILQQGTGAYRVSSASISGDLAEALGRDPKVTYQEDLSIHGGGDQGLRPGLRRTRRGHRPGEALAARSRDGG